MAETIDIFKALSDEARLRIIRALFTAELSVAELVGVLGLPQSTVSRHLKPLRDADLVETRREGTSVFYRRGPALSDGSEYSRLPTGVVVRKRVDETLSPQCLIQANADSLGTLPLMPLLWQGDLPGIAGNGAMFVRDLGPAANRTLIERFPERRPVVLLRRPPDGAIAAVQYEAGMEAMWPREGADR